MKRISFVVVLAVVAIAGFVAAPSSASASGHGALNIVHGIPGVTVDVCASGPATGGAWATIIEDFEFGDVRTFDLPAGPYDANVVAPDASCASPILPGLGASGVVLPAGANASVIAHLPASGVLGDAKLTVGVNDISETRGDRARLTVYHAAAAPAVDIRAGRWLPIRKIFRGVENMQSGDVDVRDGRYRVSILAENARWWDPVTTTRLNLAEDTNTVVYAVGSLADGSFTLLSQVIDLEAEDDDDPRHRGRDDDDDDDEDEDDDD